MAIRLLSNENIDGNLTINGTGTANAPTLAIDTTSSSTFNHAVEAFNANLTNGENNVVLIGKEGSNKNTGYIAYKWFSSGSNSNILTFGHWGSDNLMNLTGDGKLGIGTESPAEKLEVSGSIKSTSRAITGGSTPGITLSYDTSNSIGLIESWTSKPIGIETSGARRITIQNDGYVGIGTGTNSVTNQLHVHTDTDNAYALRIEGSTNNAAGVWTGIGIGGESANTKTAIIFEDIGSSYARGKLLFCINNELNQNSASPSDARMTISNDGNVGIGTTSPGAKLEIRNDVAASTDLDPTSIKLYNNSDGGSAIEFSNGVSGKSKISFGVESTGAGTDDTFLGFSTGQNTGLTERMRINSVGDIILKDYANIYASTNNSTVNSGIYFGGTDNTLRFYTSNDEKMRINSSGNVGIGETNPLVDLHVRDSSQNSNITDTVPSWWNGLFERTYTTTSNAAIGIVGSTQALGAGGVIYLGYSDDVDNNWIGVLGSQAMTFGTNTAERMRITSDGKVGINETNPTATLHVQTAGGIKLFNDNTYGYISIGSSGLTGQYPYLRVDSFRSDGSGYFWAFGHETPGGVKSIKMLINDGSSDQVTVINSLAISRFTSNEFNGSYPSLSTGALIRSNDTSYFNGGNVGIGTTSPQRKLDVGGTALIASAGNVNKGTLALGVQSSGSAKWSVITGAHYNAASGSGNGSGSAGIMMIGTHAQNGENDVVIGGAIYEANAATTIRFYTHTTDTSTAGGSERMRITSGGNVGIGATPTANEKLLVLSSTQYGASISHQKANSTSDFEDALFLINSDNNNANVCRIGMSTYGADGQHHRVSLMAERDTSANYRGEFSIAIRQSDATHPKRLKLDYAGNLTVSGDVVAYGSPSDKRYKENIKPVTNALDKVSKLQGVTFDWKESESILDIKEDIGFIAQDVQEVLPELVRENEDGKLSLRDKGIVPILVEAIKELKAEIEELKKSK